MVSKRGKHRSTDKDGRKTLASLEAIPGVKFVLIGESRGGKNIGRSRSVGAFKLQGETAAGFKGILQTAKGIQQIALILELPTATDLRKEVRSRVMELFPSTSK